VPRAPTAARVPGSGYSFDGGSAAERQTVRSALVASAFDWSLVPGHVTVHIVGRGGSAAGKGEIWLSSALLARGRASWGVVQHEYAHQVDFFLLDDSDRARLERLLGGRVWWPGRAVLRHDQYGAERFASTLAWSYWPSPQNSLIRHARAEATAMRPERFRRLLARLLAAHN
jgi:hypothetical protein